VFLLFRGDSCLSRVGNVLVGEFQADLLKISHESEENDLSKLHVYLSRGRGAVVLQILNTIGITVCFSHIRAF
jgi:hypothetical protein